MQTNILAQIVFEGTYEGASALLVIGLFILAFFVLLGILIAPAFIAAAIARRRVEKILNHRQNTVITQYEPPRGLLPAEVGLLYDMQSGQNDLVATLFDLEQRGIISITNQKNVEIISQDLYDKLLEFEKIAVRSANGASQTSESHPLQFTLHPGQTITLMIPPKKGLLSFEYAVKQSLLQKGIKMGNYTAAFALRVVIVAFIVSLLPMLLAAIPLEDTGVVYASWSVQSFQAAFSMTIMAAIFLFVPYIIFAIILVKIWTKITGRYWLNSKQARALWPEIEGYRRYIERVDIDNIQFESTTHDGQKPVTKTLPYALAFGLSTKWQDRLKSRQ